MNTMRQKIESFAWNERFSVGVESIDHQHRHLIDVVNTYATTLARSTDRGNTILEIFRELADYSSYHFEAEETIMREMGVDSRHVDRHIAEHDSFLKDVAARVGVSGNDQKETDLLDFLIHWITYHILGFDQSLGRQIQDIKNGVTPEDAFAKEQNNETVATEALVTALKNLYREVTTRNRELIALNSELEKKVAERTKQLSEANRHLEGLALTDPLTGLPNRRFAVNKLDKFWHQSTVSGQPLSCVMIDADYFKEINDSYGHDAGDMVLRVLARELKYGIRSDDIVCRLGGDEFILICPDTDLPGAMHIAESIRRRIESVNIPTGEGFWEGSISAGVACKTAEMASVSDLLKAADEGVYAAKRDGKNCVRSV